MKLNVVRNTDDIITYFLHISAIHIAAMVVMVD